MANSESFILFYGGPEPFSNFYRTKFVVDGETFNSTEQYFHYMKAVTFGDKVRARAILNSSNPWEQKKLGRAVKNFDENVWNSVCENVMLKGNLAKFSQNEHLKRLLSETAGATLVEASPTDKKWGIGMSKTHPDALNRNKWKGLNLMGKVLETVRKQL